MGGSLSKSLLYYIINAWDFVSPMATCLMALCSHTTQGSWSDDDWKWDGDYPNDEEHQTEQPEPHDDQDDQGHTAIPAKAAKAKGKRKVRRAGRPLWVPKSQWEELKKLKPQNQQEPKGRKRRKRKPYSEAPPPEDGHTGEFLMPMVNTANHFPLVCFKQELLPFQKIQAHLTRLHDVSRTLKEEADSMVPAFRAAAQSVGEASKHVEDAIRYLKGRKSLHHATLRSNYYQFYEYRGRSPTVDICPAEWKRWPEWPSLPVQPPDSD